MSDLETFLCETFSLDSSSQIRKRPTKAIGTQSVPGAYRITKNDGEVVDIFVKTVHAQSYQDAKVMEKEELMYTELIPKITAFADRHCTDMGEQVRSCFAKYYGICHEKSGAQTLVLEDYNSREGDNFVPFDLSKSVAVAKNLALLNATFLAWQQRCNPGFSRAKMDEKYPALVNYPTVFNFPELKKYANGIKQEEMTGFKFELMASIASKVLKSYIKDLEEDRSKREEIIFKIDRFVELSPNIPLLVSEIRNMETNFSDMSPILGDVHPSNIAVSANSDKVVFVDFGLCGFSCPLLDFHWFVANAAGSQWSKGNVKWLFDHYVDEFMTTAEKLGMELDREDLFEEFENTKMFSIVLELIFATFGLVWKLKMEGTSADKIGEFIHKVISLDEKDEDDIREELEKVLSKDIRMKLLNKILKCICDMDSEIMGDFEDIIDAYKEKQ